MQRCYGCMKEFGEEYEVCPHCGYIVGSEPESKNYLNTGVRLADRYVIGKVLGHGGFGITYIAWDSKISKAVAIKEYFPNAFSTRSEGETRVSCFNNKASSFFKQGIEKMLDEAKRVSRFSQNENIVDIYDFFEENNTAYIVMEYLEGKDLKKHLEENGGKLSPEKAVEIILPVLNALEDMHREKLIHRDISPDNIFLCDNGKVKLLDFGSARLAVEDAEKSLSIMLKRGYAPREQYASRTKQGPWTDVYAVCATLYKMITGELPAESTEREDEPLKKLSEFGIRNCGELEKVIFKGLEVDSRDRTRSVAELKIALIKSIKKEPGSSTKEPSDQNENSSKYLKRKIPGPFVLGAATGLIIVLILGILFMDSFKSAITDDGIMVPEFEGRNYETEIKNNPEYEIFNLEIKTVENDDFENGTILEQTVLSGQKISYETVIVLTVVQNKPKVTIPNVIGSEYDSARQTLEVEGLIVKLSPFLNVTEEYGTVIKTDPEAGEKVDIGTTIVVYYASNEDLVEVPAIAGFGFDIETAQQILESVQLVMDPEIKEENSNEPAGAVISQSPEAGEKVMPNSKVSIVISNGIPESSEASITIKLPSTNTSGSFEVYADNELLISKTLLLDGSPYTFTVEGSGSNVLIKTYMDSNEYYTCVVDFTKNPAVVTGGNYSSSVSDSGVRHIMPSVIGMTQAQAVETLVAAGFNANNIYIDPKTVYTNSENGIVIAQDPQPSQIIMGLTQTTVDVNSKITLTVGQKI